MSGTPCRKCHESTFEAYKNSVHGQAKMSGNSQAPICSSCHSAHQVGPALASRSPKATCFGCHEDAAALHKEWLPNADLHLDAIACTACHVPEAEHTVYLRVTDSSSGASINKAKLKAGDAVFVPQKVEHQAALRTTKDIVDILFKTAVVLATITVLF